MRAKKERRTAGAKRRKPGPGAQRAKGAVTGKRRTGAKRAKHAPATKRPRRVVRSALPAGIDSAHAIGIMSGTSADAVDAAVTRIEEEGGRHYSRLVSFASRPFDAATRDAILEAQEGAISAREMLTLSIRLAKLAAEAAREALAAPAALGASIEVVGYHGQTVFHDPRGERSGQRFTAQIGEPSVVAAALGAPVVSNFRMADILAGGEGAPLVPRFDWNQFGGDDADRALLNLGGIANVTRILPGAPLERVIAFDCGPANMLLDGIMAAAGPPGTRFDADGALAARGRADEGVVATFLDDPFFSRKPPKSAGREEFGAAYRDRFLARTDGARLEDRLRTAVEIVAGAVSQAIALSSARRGVPDEVIVSGGGARNRTLLRAIEALLPGSRVELSDAHGVPLDAKEAMAFAFLAHETWRGRPGNVPSATGAKAEVVLGSVTPAPRGKGTHGAA